MVLLGPGRIHCNSESYEFGEGFHDPAAAAKVQEVPGLAKALGVKSVTVALEPGNKCCRLVLHWASLPVADANAEARVAELRERQAAIKQCLPRINDTHSSPEERAEAQSALLRLLHLSGPTTPNHEELLDKLFSLGQNQFVTLGSQIDASASSELDYSRRIDADLRNRVEQISAVLYRSIGKIEVSPAAAPPAAELAEVPGQFEQSREDAMPASGFIARVKRKLWPSRRAARCRRPHGTRKAWW